MSIIISTETVGLLLENILIYERKHEFDWVLILLCRSNSCVLLCLGYSCWIILREKSVTNMLLYTNINIIKISYLNQFTTKNHLSLVRVEVLIVLKLVFCTFLSKTIFVVVIWQILLHISYNLTIMIWWAFSVVVLCIIPV